MLDDWLKKLMIGDLVGVVVRMLRVEGDMDNWGECGFVDGLKKDMDYMDWMSKWIIKWIIGESE